MELQQTELKTAHKFPYEWWIADGYPAKGIAKHGLKVFSCFSCGGGSTMGYKLAGYDVIGCNEIDPRMMEVYRLNHNPKYSFLESIVTFKDRTDLPQELYNLDILDGSPPCSSFSLAGSREDDWGKGKKFREGQAEQVLDTLFFDFIELAEKLQPKVVIAENVKGLLIGDAIEYVKKIYKGFEKAGYYVQHFLLNGADMGVPQARERVFFVCIRKDLAVPFLQQVDFFTHQPKINLKFSEKPVPFKAIKDGLGRPITEHAKQAWDARHPSDSKLSHSKARAGMKETDFNCHYAFDDKVLHTLTAKGNNTIVLFDKPVYISDTEYIKGSSFPLDYDFKTTQAPYLCGMSVPPVMTAQIAHQIYLQWLSKI